MRSEPRCQTLTMFCFVINISNVSCLNELISQDFRVTLESILSFQINVSLCRDNFHHVFRHFDKQSQPVSDKNKHFYLTLTDKFAPKDHVVANAAVSRLTVQVGRVPKHFHIKTCKYRVKVEL